MRKLVFVFITVFCVTHIYAGTINMSDFRKSQRLSVLKDFKAVYKQRHLSSHKAKLRRKYNRVKKVSHSGILDYHNPIDIDKKTDITVNDITEMNTQNASIQIDANYKDVNSITDEIKYENNKPENTQTPNNEINNNPLSDTKPENTQTPNSEINNNPLSDTKPENTQTSNSEINNNPLADTKSENIDQSITTDIKVENTEKSLSSDTKSESIEQSQAQNSDIQNITKDEPKAQSNVKVDKINVRSLYANPWRRR